MTRRTKQLDFRHYPNIPAATQMALRLYVEEGRLPGSFLTAVLCNDLFRAVDHADEQNAAALPSLVKFIYNQLPGPAWGSAQRMREYLAIIWATAEASQD